MPRSGWRKSDSDRRLSDLVSVGLLTRVFPPGVVDEVIAASGRTEIRSRSLPAKVMAYFVLGMALYSEGSYDDIFGQLTDGLSWSSRWREVWAPPSRSAIFQARARLGSGAMEALFRRVAKPLSAPGTVGGWLAGRRLVSIDGTCLDVPDRPENAVFFGRPGVNKGEQAAFPQVRVLGLVECASHAVFDAVIAPVTSGETTLADELLGRLQPGMLCLADRGFYGFRLWQRAAATGADLLWRMKSTQRLDPIEVLADGSYLAKIFENQHARKRDHGVTVRVIEYSIDDGRDNDNDYRLITTIIDPETASATELALAYAQRWEIENVYDELKTHQRGPKAVLRSKSPDLVLQEIWGHLGCHYAIRTMMWDAADETGVEALRVSFTAALRVTRRSIAQRGDFSPSAH